MPRPKLNPTDEQRRLVKSMAAMGIPQDEIARKLDIRSPKTLREHFRDELDRGARMPTTTSRSALYKQAMNGNTSAAIFWLKTRAGWRERSATGTRDRRTTALYRGA